MEAPADIELALDNALAHHRAGCLGSAERGYRLVLEKSPDHCDALNFLGVLLQDQGRFPESLQCLHHAVALDPNFADALTNLARAQQGSGQSVAAAASARRAIGCDPDLPEAYLQLGRSLIDVGLLDEAVTVLAQAIIRDPSLPETHVHLGVAYLGLDRTEQAKRAFDTARQQSPSDSKTILKIGAAWFSSSKLDEAKAAYQRAIELDALSATAHSGLAFIARSQNHIQEMIDAARRVVELAPDRSDMWLLLGQGCANLGQFDEAGKCFRKALETDPASARGRRDLVSLGLLVAGDTDILATILKDKDASRPDRIAAAFGLGAALDQVADYDAAFAAYAQGNRMVREDRVLAGKGFAPGVARYLVDWLVTTFAPHIFADANRPGVVTDELVFVVGMPRSGTSLVEQIAASHPEVYGAGEQKLIGNMVDRLDGFSKTSPALWSIEDVKAEANQNLDRYRRLSGGAARIIDKMPDNIFLLGHIAFIFPNAKIVFCTRDARDTCLSAYFQHFDGDMSWCYDLEDAAEQAHQVARLTEHWRKVLPLRMLEMNYETVVGDLEGQSRRLVDFLGLEWHPACLSFHKTNRPVMTASFWQVKQPLYASSVDRWKHYSDHIRTLGLALHGIIPKPSESEWNGLLLDAAAALKIAVSHRSSGRPAVADEIVDAVLVREPNNSKALHLRGASILSRNLPSQAIPWLLRARDRRPANAELLVDLARAYQFVHDHAAAATAAREAIQQDPSSSAAWCQLGHAVIEQGDEAEALAAMERSQALLPEGREQLLGLAAILHRLRRMDHSEEVLRKAVRLFPTDDAVLGALSVTLMQQAKYDESIEICLTALRCNPDNPSLHVRLGFNYLRALNVEDAVRVLTHAVSLDERQVDGWLLLGFGRAALGDRQEAARCYRKVLALDPENGEALCGLVGVSQNEQIDDVLAVATRVLGNPASTILNKAAAAFAAAQTHDGMGDYEDAFSAFQTANALIRKTRKSFHSGESVNELRKLVDWIIRTFPPGAVGRDQPQANQSDVPTFVVGLPRSGTSLVEQIAASHPEVLGLGEKGDFLGLLGAELRPMFMIPPDQWNMVKVQEASRSFVQSFAKPGTHARRVINKSPSNVYWIGHILKCFPNAHIILCTRNLRDVCWSCYTQNFLDDEMSWTDTLEDCAAHARQIERLMNHWRLAEGGRILEIKYEDVVENIEREARKIIGYLDLPWDAACLLFHETKRIVMTASHSQVRRPLYATSVGRWKHYRKHLDPLLQGLGYSAARVD